jgi:hypothetical protein
MLSKKRFDELGGDPKKVCKDLSGGDFEKWSEYLLKEPMPIEFKVLVFGGNVYTPENLGVASLPLKISFRYFKKGCLLRTAIEAALPSVAKQRRGCFYPRRGCLLRTAGSEASSPLKYLKDILKRG